MLKKIFALAVGLALSAIASAATLVEVTTSQGKFTLELYPDKAPQTVEAFLGNARNHYYDGTIFHRVINDFMIQGGGFTANMQEKRPLPPKLRNEADNGLRNERGTIAMARGAEPHSAAAQFFINLNDNDALNHRAPADSRSWGFAVFGRVVRGMETVDRVAMAPVGEQGPYQNVPMTPIVIQKMEIIADPRSQAAGAAAKKQGGVVETALDRQMAQAARTNNDQASRPNAGQAPSRALNQPGTAARQVGAMANACPVTYREYWVKGWTRDQQISVEERTPNLKHWFGKEPGSKEVIGDAPPVYFPQLSVDAQTIIDSNFTVLTQADWQAMREYKRQYRDALVQAFNAASKHYDRNRHPELTPAELRAADLNLQESHSIIDCYLKQAAAGGAPRLAGGQPQARGAVGAVGQAGGASLAQAGMGKPASGAADAAGDGGLQHAEQSGKTKKPDNHCLRASKKADGSLDLLNVCRQRVVVAYCYTEVDAGSNKAEYACRAQKSEWAIDGMDYATQWPGAVEPGKTMNIAWDPKGKPYRVTYVGCMAPYIFPVIASYTPSGGGKGYCRRPAD